MVKYVDHTQVVKRMNGRLVVNKLLRTVFLLATLFALATLGILVYRMFDQGWGYLSVDFISNFASRFPEKAGIKAALVGSIF